jgi:hypothetical protein
MRSTNMLLIDDYWKDVERMGRGLSEDILISIFFQGPRETTKTLNISIVPARLD